MKLFLTGATGFVGGHLLKRLLREGHEVRCLVRSGAWAARLAGQGAKPFPGDILEPQTVVAGMKGADAVIQLVGIIKEIGAATFERVHFEGAKNVIDVAKQNGIRKFIQMSALGVRPNARSRYHQTKYRAEEYLKGSGLEYTIFRPSVIFGPGDGFVNLVADLVRKAPIVPLPGGGHNRLQPVSVYDVAEFFTQALVTPRSSRQTLDLGGPENLEYREIVRRVMQVLGKKKPTVSVPISLMKIPVFLMDRLIPRWAPLTWDQFLMLQEDNVCDMKPALNIFPIRLRKFEEGIREYL